jgi:tRNA (guanine26-N2/guanine27-N2)-dimethyltransferase
MSKFVNSGSFSKVEKQVPTGFKTINEGCATTLYGEANEAFYNKVQVFNRDMSILVIKMFDEIRRNEYEASEIIRKEKHTKKNDGTEYTPLPHVNLNILEALSATGLRSVRYWKEIPNVRRIIANDIVPDAVEVIRRNVNYNDISEEHVVPHLGDATAYMHEIAAKNRGAKTSNEDDFHVVDLDPYGGANPFLDSAVQAIGDGGLLCVTCTDMAVLAGQQPGACFAKYGSLPVRVKSCHEQGLRILLGSIQNHCSRYGRYIVPLISLSIDFYVRVFVRVFTSQNEVKTVFRKYSNVIVCNACEGLTFHKFSERIPPNAGKCEECGGNQKMSGPIWSAPIHNPEFVEKCIKHVTENKERFATNKRIIGMLTVVSKEVPDAPLYYPHSLLSSKLKINSPPIASIRSAIWNAGYNCSQTHCKPDGIKTNAPINVLFDIYREWHRQFPESAEKGKTKSGREKKEEEPTDVEDDVDDDMGEVPAVGNAKLPKHDDNIRSSISQILRAKETLTKVDFTLREEAKLNSKITGVPAFLPNPEDNWGPGKRAKSSTKRTITDVKTDGELSSSPDSKVSKLT